ncbi:hypothetical protein ACFL6U_06165 [Planctomycetota bacterium]
MNLNGPEERDYLFEPEEPNAFEEEDVSEDLDEEDGFMDQHKHHKRYRFDDSDPPEKHDHKKRDAGKRRFHPKQRHDRAQADDDINGGNYAQ